MCLNYCLIKVPQGMMQKIVSKYRNKDFGVAED